MLEPTMDSLHFAWGQNVVVRVNGETEDRSEEHTQVGHSHFWFFIFRMLLILLLQMLPDGLDSFEVSLAVRIEEAQARHYLQQHDLANLRV